jgi:hypothetical protein
MEKRATTYDGTHRRYSENTEISGSSAAIIVNCFLQSIFLDVAVSQRQEIIEIFWTYS